MFARIVRFIVPPLLLLVAIGSYRAYCLTQGFHSSNHMSPSASERRLPWSITPRYDWPFVVTDEQLFAVLDRLKPPPGPADSNLWLHALRLWGDRAEFDDSSRPSGRKMKQYFLDDRVYRETNGDDVPPLYRMDSVTGDVSVRDWSRHDPYRTTSSYHLNDILATLGETNTPLDRSLMTRDGVTDVASLLETAMRRFHLRQHEYEWSVISYARYVYPDNDWRNEYGERISIAGIVDQLIQPKLGGGPCNGLHRLEAIVVLDGANGKVASERRSLARRSRQKMLSHMNHVVGRLMQAQNDEGYWTRKWPEGVSAKIDVSAPLSDRILVTGHHLEWLALAPAEVEPSRQMVVQAAQWLVRAIVEVDNETLHRHYGPFSHAGRALCLWRSKDPYETWRAGKDARSSKIDPADVDRQ